MQISGGIINDIAVYRTERPFEIEPMKLYRPGIKPNECYLSGYDTGVVFPREGRTVRVGEVRILNDHKHFFFTDPVSSIKDTGGPLYCVQGGEKYLIGVYRSTSEHGSFYTRVDIHDETIRNWIAKDQTSRGRQP